MATADVRPTYTLSGEVRIPSSKPHIQRALLLALLRPQVTTLHNISWCTETAALLVALRDFGLQVLDQTDTTLTLRGVGRNLLAPREIFAAGSGMLFRTCAALAALLPSPITIRCNDSLMSRESLLDDAFFSQLGIRTNRLGDNKMLIHRAAHDTIEILEARHSTQFITFALMVAPLTSTRSLLILPNDLNGGYVQMTLAMMRAFEADVSCSGNQVIASEYGNSDIEITIPTDFTSVSYIASAVLSTGDRSDVEISNYHSGATLNEQTLLTTYRSLGLRVDESHSTSSIRFRSAEADVEPSSRLSLKELPSAAANIIAATSNRGITFQFSNVSGINNHKCQRAFVISENIRKMGGANELVFDSVGRFDGIKLGGGTRLEGGVCLSSFRDHRICAANVIASLGARTGSKVQDVEMLDDGFPGFIDALVSIGGQISINEYDHVEPFGT